MSEINDVIVELDYGVRPEAAISNPVYSQSEDVAILSFNAMRATSRVSPYGGFTFEDAGTAIVEFHRLWVSRFGYPNDEARDGFPDYEDVAYGIYEAQNSSWIKEVVRLNRRRFPQTPKDLGVRHFLFTFHEDTFECLAGPFNLEVRNEPWSVIFEHIQRRAYGL